MTIPSSLLNKVPDITFNSGEEAEAVLDAMKQTIKVFDLVTVAEYRQLARLLPVTHQDYKVGWVNLDEARVVYSRKAYMLDLPLVVQLP